MADDSQSHDELVGDLEAFELELFFAKHEFSARWVGSWAVWVLTECLACVRFTCAEYAQCA